MKHVLLMAVLSLALVACAPGASNRGAAGDVSPTQYQAAVEVDNGTGLPVVVKYYSQSGGPFFLAEVGANQRSTIRLPASDVGHIFAETLDGQRFSTRTSTVQIRRVEAPNGN
jgi:hypothetical protein